MDVFGDKGELIRRIEKMSFENYLYKKNPEDACKELSDLSLENLLKNIKRAPKDKSWLSVEELEEMIREGKP